MQIFLLIIHVLVSVLLIVVILIQRGRGGGLVESFSGMESMFGTKTSQFLTRATAILAILFLCSSISLALLAARQTRSLIDEKEISPPEEDTQKVEVKEGVVKAGKAEEDIPEKEVTEGQSAGVQVPGEEVLMQEEVTREKNKTE